MKKSYKEFLKNNGIGFNRNEITRKGILSLKKASEKKYKAIMTPNAQGGYVRYHLNEKKQWIRSKN